MLNYLEKKRHNKYKNHLHHNLHILRFGNYGIKALGFGQLKESTINSLERFITKNLKIISKTSNTFKIWNILQINTNRTALSPESRMGKGKGAIAGKFATVKSGQLLFEFSGTSETQAKVIWKQLNSKVPFPTKLLATK